MAFDCKELNIYYGDHKLEVFMESSNEATVLDLIIDIEEAMEAAGLTPPENLQIFYFCDGDVDRKTMIDGDVALLTMMEEFSGQLGVDLWLENGEVQLPVVLTSHKLRETRAKLQGQKKGQQTKYTDGDGVDHPVPSNEDRYDDAVFLDVDWFPVGSTNKSPTGKRFKRMVIRPCMRKGYEELKKKAKISNRKSTSEQLQEVPLPSSQHLFSSSSPSSSTQPQNKKLNRKHKRQRLHVLLFPAAEVQLQRPKRKRSSARHASGELIQQQKMSRSEKCKLVKILKTNPNVRVSEVVAFHLAGKQPRSSNVSTGASFVSEGDSANGGGGAAGSTKPKRTATTQPSVYNMAGFGGSSGSESDEDWNSGAASDVHSASSGSDCSLDEEDVHGEQFTDAKCDEDQKYEPLYESSDDEPVPYTDRVYSNGYFYPGYEFGSIKLRQWHIFTDKNHFLSVLREYCIQDLFD